MVAVLAVFPTKVVQAEPPSIDFSILYPVMGEPPLSAGAVQLKLIWEGDTAVAVRPDGDDGATARVVADGVLEGEPVPMELIAETL